MMSRVYYLPKKRTFDFGKCFLIIPAIGKVSTTSPMLSVRLSKIEKLSGKVLMVEVSEFFIFQPGSVSGNFGNEEASFSIQKTKIQKIMADEF